MNVYGIKARNEKKPYSNMLKAKQINKKRNRGSKTYKKTKTEAYYVKEAKKQKQINSKQDLYSREYFTNSRLTQS